MDSGRPPVTPTTRLTRRAAGLARAPRMVPEETPVALSFAGTTHAVMMASPADLEDFAVNRDLVADRYRFVEHDPVHRHGHRPALGAARGDQAGGRIHQAHQPAAEDVAIGVGVGRHRGDADGGIAALGHAALGHQP